jgi:hypothetical protein
VFICGAASDEHIFRWHPKLLVSPQQQQGYATLTALAMYYWESNRQWTSGRD